MFFPFFKKNITHALNDVLTSGQWLAVSFPGGVGLLE